MKLSLDWVPEGIDAEQVRDYLRGQPGVQQVHDLHIWPLSTTETALTAHLVKPDASFADDFLARLSRELCATDSTSRTQQSDSNKHRRLSERPVRSSQSVTAFRDGIRENQPRTPRRVGEDSPPGT